MPSKFKDLYKLAIKEKNKVRFYMLRSFKEACSVKLSYYDTYEYISSKKIFDVSWSIIDIAILEDNFVDGFVSDLLKIDEKNSKVVILLLHTSRYGQ